MGKLIRSDGNGGLIVSKGVALTLSIITLCSVVWACSSSYVVGQTVKPFEQRVAKLEKISEERTVFLQQHCILEAERNAKIDAKMDLILEKLEEQKGR